MSFRSLNRDAIEHARSRSAGALSADEIIKLARRAGAPVEPSAADGAAAGLLAELAAGRRPAPGLSRLLAHTFDRGAELSPAERSAAEWVGRDDRERGEALLDLLLLGDALPAERRAVKSRFPSLAAAAR